MVVQGILALALALPTGLLFGVGYGTGVRIGYEQVYPLLFPKDSVNRNVTPTVNNIRQINGIYNLIGGKEASQMGIAMGLQGAMEEIDRNPDFRDLEALELRLSGRTQSRLGTEAPSSPTSISDFPLGSSLDPSQPAVYAKDKNGNLIIPLQQIGGFNAELYILVKKQQAENAPLPADLGNKSQLGSAGKSTIQIEKELKSIPSKKVLAASVDPVYIAWIAKLGQLKVLFQKEVNSYNSTSAQKVTRSFTQRIRQNQLNSIQNKLRGITSQIRSMSNDYRNPNNHIRENAVRLRRSMNYPNYKYIFKP